MRKFLDNFIMNRENIENFRVKYLFPPSLEKIIDLMNYADDLGGDHV